MSQRPTSRNAQQKVAEMRRQQRARQRQLRILGGVAALAALALVVVAVIALTAGRAKTQAGVHGAARGATVDGIACQTSEQAAYHIHAHLAIFDSGSAHAVPAGIGIPGPQQVVGGFVEGGKCLYWLHTHDATGIIHIESPVRRVYTLGQFFDLWGKPLSSTQVGSTSGTVTAFVNGKRFGGDPRSIKLTPHAVIQLDVGTAVPPRPYTFPSGL
jgi:hypothetical protein